MNAVRAVLRDIGGHRRWVLVTALLGALASGSGIGLVAFSAVLISRSALLSSTASLALLIVAVRFFATTRVVLRYTERVVGHLATFRLLTRLRTWFFASAIPIAPRGLTDHRTGELLDTILDDVDTMQDVPLRLVIPPLVSISTIIVAVVVIAASSPRSALILLIIAVLTAVALPTLLHRRSRSAAPTITGARSAAAADLLETLDGARELIALDALAPVLQRLETHEVEVDRARLSLARTRSAGAALLALAAAGTALLVTGIAITEVASGALPGELLALIPLVAMATFESIAPLLPILDTLDRSSAAAMRIRALATTASATPTITTPTIGTATVTATVTATNAATNTTVGPPAGALVLEHVRHAHRPDHEVLVDVSCTIAAGSVVVITGESGCGKSTLVDLLLRFDEPGGSIRHDGVELTELDPSVARNCVAVVRQRDHIFDTTIRDNLALADPDASDEELLEVLAVAGLADVVGALPAGLDTRTGPDGSELSGGERQRLLIARAMLADRPILILDEALEHLDGTRRTEVLDAVLRRRRGRTTIVISHDDPAVASPGLWLELRDGRFTTRA